MLFFRVNISVAKLKISQDWCCQLWFGIVVLYWLNLYFISLKYPVVKLHRWEWLKVVVCSKAWCEWSAVVHILTLLKQLSEFVQTESVYFLIRLWNCLLELLVRRNEIFKCLFINKYWISAVSPSLAVCQAGLLCVRTVVRMVLSAAHSVLGNRQQRFSSEQ